MIKQILAGITFLAALPLMAATGTNLPFSASNAAAFSSTGSMDEFPIPAFDSNLVSIVSGMDGNLWFTESRANQIGRITPRGVITEFPIPTANSNPSGITLGPDGAIWFTESSANKIGRLDPNRGEIKEYTVPTPSSYPFGITRGPGGKLWFAETRGNRIGWVDPDSGVVHDFPVSASAPLNIAWGPDGNLWFTQRLRDTIGRVTLTKNRVNLPFRRQAAPPMGSPEGWTTIFGLPKRALTRSVELQRVARSSSSRSQQQMPSRSTSRRVRTASSGSS